MKSSFIQAAFLLTISIAALLFGPLPASAKDSHVAPKDFSFSKKTYIYKVVDNHPIMADVYRTPGDDIRPAILWIHGGALIIGTRSAIPSEQLKLYLMAGYVLISMDYRLAPETKLDGILEDLRDAYAWVREAGPGLFRVDPDRIAVIGHSAGGYLALTAGFRLRPSPRTVVSFYGFGDITGPWYSRPDPFYLNFPEISVDQAMAGVGDSVITYTPTRAAWHARYNFYLYCRQQGLWPQQVSGHDPARDSEWFEAFEPIRNVTAAYPATVLVHGKKDTDVAFEQSVQMAETLERHGVAYEFISNKEWGHGFDLNGMEDAAVKKAFARVLAFMEKQVVHGRD